MNAIRKSKAATRCSRQKNWSFFNGSSSRFTREPKQGSKSSKCHSITARLGELSERLFFLLPFVRIFTKLTGKQVVKEIDVNESVAVPSSGLQARERKRPCVAMKLSLTATRRTCTKQFRLCFAQVVLNCFYTELAEKFINFKVR